MSVYVVQPGDSPVRIAQKLTGNGALYTQLVAANPQVPRVRLSNGMVTFAGLSVGQQLAIPSSWANYGGGVYGVGQSSNPRPNVPPDTPRGWGAPPSAFGNPGEKVIQLGPNPDPRYQDLPSIPPNYGVAQYASDVPRPPMTPGAGAGHHGGGPSFEYGNRPDDTGRGVGQARAGDVPGRPMGPGAGPGHHGGGPSFEYGNRPDDTGRGVGAMSARAGQAVCPPGMFWFAGNAAAGAGCYPRSGGGSFPGQCPAGTVADSITGQCVAPCSDGSAPAHGVCPQCPAGTVADSITGQCVAPCRDGNAPANGLCPPLQPQRHGVGAPSGCTWQRWTGQVALGTQGTWLYAALAAAPGSTIPYAAVPPAGVSGPLYWQSISAWGYLWGLRTFNGLTTLFVCMPTQLRAARFQGVGNVSTIALELQQLNNSASVAPVADADGSYAGSVGAYQIAGAGAVQQLGPDLDSTYASYSGYNNSLTQSAWQANANLQALNNVAGSAQLQDAQNAQQTLQQMAAYYGTASNLGQQAAAAGGGSGGGGVPTLPTWNAATTDAAQAVVSASGSLCNLGGSTSGNATVNAFQAAYNTNPVVPPAAALPLLVTDGKYGPLTAAAVGLVLGGGAPAACKVYSNPPGGGGAVCPAGQTLVNGQCVTTAPAGCGAGQVTDSVTGLCVAACPAGQIPANGVCITPAVTPPATGVVAASNGPLLAGVLIAALGVGAVSYAVTHKKGRARRRR